MLARLALTGVLPIIVSPMTKKMRKKKKTRKLKKRRKTAARNPTVMTHQ
jgi:hypothetical protein